MAYDSDGIRDYADGVPVYCCFDKIVKLQDLKPNPKNPNKHPDEQIGKLAKVIKGNGWRNPITVSKLSGLIVKGHGRLLAAQKLRLKEVPVEYQEYESDAAELADLMADNRIAELSKNDKRKLLNLFEEYDTGEVDFELSGYEENEYKNLAHQFDEFSFKGVNGKEEEGEEVGSVKAPTSKIIYCPNCGEEIEV